MHRTIADFCIVTMCHVTLLSSFISSVNGVFGAIYMILQYPDREILSFFPSNLDVFSFPCDIIVGFLV